jgi:hypothetical protein
MGGGLASLPGGGGGGCRGEGARGAPPILKLKAENLFNRVGERPAIEKPIAMGRVQRAESQMRASQAEDADLARTENLFRTIRRAADKRKSERRAAAAIGRVQMLVPRPPATLP